MPKTDKLSCILFSLAALLLVWTAGAGAPLVTFGFPGEPVYHIVVVRVKNGTATTEMVKVKE